MLFGPTLDLVCDLSMYNNLNYKVYLGKTGIKKKKRNKSLIPTDEKQSFKCVQNLFSSPNVTSYQK